MPAYTLRRSGGSLPTVTASLAEWGVPDDSVRLEFATRTTDRMTFSLAAAFDAADTFPFGATVELLRDGAVVFLGRVTSMPRTGSDGAESLTVECAGPWWYLDHLVYEQLWTVPDTSPGAALGATLTKPLTRIIIGRDLGAAKITAAAFITEVFAFLADKIPAAPVSLGDIHASLASEIPTEEARDLTVGEAILRVLRWYPDIEPTWDLSPGHATLHFRRRGDMRLALDPAVAPVRDIALKARPDLRPSCVLIRYQRANEQGGDAGVEIIEDKWPPAADEYALDALRLVVELEGGSGQIVTQYIRVENIAVAYPTWWARHLPALKSDKVSELAVVTGSYSVKRDEDAAADALVYTREILDGALPWWKSYRETPVICAAKLTYKVTLDSGAVEERAEEARVRIRSTDAETGNYAYAGDYRAPEPAPEGLARRYYEALASLVHEGSLTHDPGEWDGVSCVGRALDLPGFATRPDWASLGAPIVGHTVELSAGRSTYTLGPAKHLAPDDWVSLARPARGIAHATRPVATQRATGRYAPASGSASGPATPAAASGSPRATPSVLALTSSSSPLAQTASARMSFEVFADPVSPTPASGATAALKIVLGLCNDAVATLPGDPTPRRGAQVLLPGPFPPGNSEINPGPWHYIYLEVKWAPTRAVIKSGDTCPEDSDSTMYIPLAAIRPTKVTGGTWGYLVTQLRVGDINQKPPLPFEVTPVLDGDQMALSMRAGRATLVVADIAAASGFGDASSFAGRVIYPYPDQKIYADPPGGGTKSLWIAFEYPQTGARLASADHAKLKYDDTSLMPAPVPWVRVAEANANAEAARGSGDAAVATKAAQGGATTGESPAQGQTASDALAKINAIPLESGDLLTWTIADTARTVKVGPWTASIADRVYTYKVTRTVAGVNSVIKSGCETGIWSAYLSDPDGAANKTSNKLGSTYYAYNQLTNYSQSMNPAGTYTNGVTGSTASGVWRFVSTNGTTSSFASGYLVASGAKLGDVKLQASLQTVMYSSGTWVASGAPTYLDVSTYGVPANNYVDSSSTSNGQPPDGDRPGRAKSTPAAAPISGAAAPIASLDKNGQPVKAPGPGVWVFELARVYPDGRIEQRQIGDIVIYPAPQIQLRTNPKIAALP